MSVKGPQASYCYGWFVYPSLSCTAVAVMCHLKWCWFKVINTFFCNQNCINNFLFKHSTFFYYENRKSALLCTLITISIKYHWLFLKKNYSASFNMTIVIVLKSLVSFFLNSGGSNKGYIPNSHCYTRSFTGRHGKYITIIHYAQLHSVHWNDCIWHLSGPVEVRKEGLEMQINRLAELIGRLENKVAL